MENSAHIEKLIQQNKTGKELVSREAMTWKTELHMQMPVWDLNEQKLTLIHSAWFSKTQGLPYHFFLMLYICSVQIHQRFKHLPLYYRAGRY